jgi:hypothetical protein
VFEDKKKSKKIKFFWKISRKFKQIQKKLKILTKNFPRWEIFERK